MAEKHVLAEQDYMQGLKYKEIAEKYDVTLNTVKSWKQRHGWQRNKGAPDQKGVHTKRKGAPDGNKNALGNEGGAPKGNNNAVTHGFFQKYLSTETLEIMEQIAERSPLDMLWDQITIQYTAIIRAQRIMYVRDQDDMTKVVKKDMEIGTEYDIQHAWDKQATFISAQSRAMGELRGLIKDFMQLSDESDERRLKLERMQLDIDKKKLEVKEMSGDNESDAHAQGAGYAEALNAQAAEVFADEVNEDEEA
ncbi:phage terminase small subunit [Paenibacillus popilliae]|uniref:Uncharacterized conserved protein n=1 Tax=Paenibacillus popilliae ATCC 14706 TaxID=1212764 RepID=M9LP88_PAEPP|nr:phage terminase small subunit [Paenibacillus popilliae]GAC42291.1 uncharacterized conserved protein [Paenibacillus popilliae ATCC 14706]